MQYSHILWDFNGTLLDDVGLGLECINLLLASRSLPPVPHRDAYRRHFRFPIRDYYASVGFDFSKDPYDVLAHEWIDLYRAREDTCPLYDGVVELLEYIRSVGTPQILFSATQREMLLGQTDGLGITHLFDEILGSTDIYAEGKVALGKAWMERTRPARALLIGDTVHDAQAAAEMGIECLLVAQGHHSPETLAATGNPVVSDLAAVRGFLQR